MVFWAKGLVLGRGGLTALFGDYGCGGLSIQLGSTNDIPFISSTHP